MLQAVQSWKSRPLFKLEPFLDLHTKQMSNGKFLGVPTTALDLPSDVSTGSNTSREELEFPWFFSYFTIELLHDSLHLLVLYHLPYPLCWEARPGWDPVPSNHTGRFLLTASNILGNPRQMDFIWVFLLLLLNEYEEEGESDPGKRRMTQKGNEPGNDPQKSILAFFLRLAVGFLKWYFFNFILKY